MRVDLITSRSLVHLAAAHVAKRSPPQQIQERRAGPLGGGGETGLEWGCGGQTESSCILRVYIFVWIKEYRLYLASSLHYFPTDGTSKKQYHFFEEFPGQGQFGRIAARVQTPLDGSSKSPWEGTMLLGTQTSQLDFKPKTRTC